LRVPTQGNLTIYLLGKGQPEKASPGEKKENTSKKTRGIFEAETARGCSVEDLL